MKEQRKLRTMDDIPLDGKRVILRVDFNVSTTHDQAIGNDEDYRMESAIDTIQELRRRRCVVLVMTHREQHGGANDGMDLDLVWKHLEGMLKDEVRKLPKLSGSEVEAIVSGLEPGAVALYPNVRHDEREKNINERFGEEVAAVADAYVNEAFSADHRAHTSVAVLPRLLPSCAGRHTVREVEMLTKLRQHPRRPYVAIVSGAKVVTKVGMLRELLPKVDTLCLGGQIANTFLAARGDWANTFHANEIAAAQAILAEAGQKLLLPIDVVLGDADGKNAREVAIDAIPKGTTDLWDIGPKSTHAIVKVCQTANTVMWNGPVGRFEVPAYSLATKAVATALANMPAYRVVGGGDTVNALELLRITDKYDHVSVGGGAMIAFLEGKRMPGLEPLYS